MWVWGFWDRVVAVTAVGAGLPSHETSEAWPEPVTPPFEFLIAFFFQAGESPTPLKMSGVHIIKTKYNVVSGLTTKVRFTSNIPTALRQEGNKSNYRTTSTSQKKLDNPFLTAAEHPRLTNILTSTTRILDIEYSSVLWLFLHSRLILLKSFILLHSLQLLSISDHPGCIVFDPRSCCHRLQPS
jgi:hypothetical protein